MSVEAAIRPARPDEAALLTDLALRAKASWGYDDEFMAACVRELTIRGDDIRNAAFFVLEEDGQVIGFCGLRDDGDGRGELVDVFVEPRRLRRGHGRRLVEHAKRVARERGWLSVVVQADPNARDFYLSCGGRQTGTVPSGSIPGRRLPLIDIDL